MAISTVAIVVIVIAIVILAAGAGYLLLGTSTSTTSLTSSTSASSSASTIVSSSETSSGLILYSADAYVNESTILENAFTSSTGIQMAPPKAAGSLALAQQIACGALDVALVVG